MNVKEIHWKVGMRKLVRSDVVILEVPAVSDWCWDSCRTCHT